MKGGKVREATPADAQVAGQLLHDFNSEFDVFTPGPEIVADRLRGLLEEQAVRVLLAGDPPVGISLMRFRPSLWTETLDCYVEELYVAPDQRGHGLGRALMEHTLELARAEGVRRIELGTDEDDTAARGLYESLGFTYDGFFLELELK